MKQTMPWKYYRSTYVYYLGVITSLFSPGSLYIQPAHMYRGCSPPPGL